MTFDRLLNAGFILGSAYLLGRKLEKEKTWKQVVKFFPGDEGERLYNSTPEFLYGLFLSTAFITAQNSISDFVVEGDDKTIEIPNLSGLYL